MRRAIILSVRVASAAVAAAVGLAACGGGSKSPGVASLSGSARPGVTTTTVPTGNATELLDRWAACMRQHGDPGQTDPVIDADGVIHITAPTGAMDAFQASQSSCQSYLSAASTALGGHAGREKPSYAKLLAYSKCMRSHGFADFPDPSPGGGLSIQVKPGSDLNPQNPAFKSASTTCGKAAGVPAFGSGHPQPGAVDISGSGGPGGGPSGGAGGGNGVVSGSGSQTAQAGS